MKIQNLAIIFIIATLPIILLLSYYMSLQRDTLNLQTSYNTKLLESAKDAIEAFEINSVEWNAEYSRTADSKRRDVMASINTFVSSFANNIGIGGVNKEYILSYIPAIAFIGYDGYYIYSPAYVPKTITDENEVTVRYTKSLVDQGTIVPNSNDYDSDDEEKILYEVKDGHLKDGKYIDKDGKEFFYTLNSDEAEKEYKHILKQYIPYSARYEGKNSDGDDVNIVVNYTLDNYITVTGTIGDKFVRKSGYCGYEGGYRGYYVMDYHFGLFVSWVHFPITHRALTCGKLRTSSGVPDSGIDFNGSEFLHEFVYYTGITDAKAPDYPYIYDLDKNKIYYDAAEKKTFIVRDGNRKDLDDIHEETGNIYFREICMPTLDLLLPPEDSVLYQNLNKINPNSIKIFDACSTWPFGDHGYLTYRTHLDPIEFYNGKYKLNEKEIPAGSLFLKLDDHLILGWLAIYEYPVNGAIGRYMNFGGPPNGDEPYEPGPEYLPYAEELTRSSRILLPGKN